MRITLALIVLLLGTGAHAQDGDHRHLDVSIQFSGFDIQNLTTTGGPNTTLAKGFDLGAAWYPSRNIALVGDFGYHHISDSKGAFSATTIMGGPRYWSGEHYRLSCYGQLLFGAARLRQDGGFNPGTYWKGTAALGGGIEVRITDRIVLRPIAIDEMLIGLGRDALGSGRVGTGIVYLMR